MKKIKQTQKEPYPEWLFGQNPNAIEKQEAEGQQELVNGSQLPRYLNDGGRKEKEAIADYLTMGIEVWASFEGKMCRIVKDMHSQIDKDQLFITAKLPAGWQLKATEHSMWNSLLDASGNKRGSIFYKAAFYDRDAFINLECRYGTKNEYFNGEKDKDGCTIQRIMAYDFQLNKALWSSEKLTYNESEAAYRTADEYLKTAFPDYHNPHAYWE